MAVEGVADSTAGVQRGSTQAPADDGAGASTVTDSTARVQRSGTQAPADDGAGASTASVDDTPIARLRHALKQQLARALDVFRDWDEDSSGSLSRKEFRKALSALGLGREYRDEVDGLFDSFDGYRSGSISYNELVRQLREHSPDAPPSGAREIVVSSKNKTTLRHASGGEKGAALAPSVKLDPSSDRPIQTQILEALQVHRVRVIDLFKDWDDDGKGTVDKKVQQQSCGCVALTAAQL